MGPEASKATNLGDFPKDTLAKGLVFSLEGFGAGGVAAGADTSIGLDGIGGAVVGEMFDIGTLEAPTFRFICISKSPTYHKVT